MARSYRLRTARRPSSPSNHGGPWGATALSFLLATFALGSPAPVQAQDAILTELRGLMMQDVGGLEWEEVAQRVSVSFDGAPLRDLVCYSALVAPEEVAREIGMDEGGWGKGYDTREPNLGLWVARSITDRVEPDREGVLRGCAPSRGVVPGDRFVRGDRLVINGIFDFPDVLEADFWYETITAQYRHEGPVWFVMAVPADEAARSEYLARPVVVLLNPEARR